MWENFKVHPRVVLVLKQGYCLPFKQKPPLTRFRAIKRSYSTPVKQKALLEAVQQMVQKRGSGSGSKQELSRILQSFVSGTKTRKQLASSNRSQCGKYIFACSHLQNGNRGSHSGFFSDRRVGGFHRSHLRLFSCAHSPKISKISALSCTGSGLSVQSPTLRHCNCSIGVHSSGERGQIHSSFTRGSNSSVFGRLAGENQGSGHLCSRCSKIDHSGRKIGVDCQFEKNLSSTQLRISSFWVIISTFNKVWSIQIKRKWTNSKFWQFPFCKVTLLLQGSSCH